MGKATKATKRFSKNHLGGEIKTRKRRQKVQFRDKKKWGASKTEEELAADKIAKAEKKGGGPAERPPLGEDDEEDDDEVIDEGGAQRDTYGGDVDSFLESGFFNALGEDDDEEEESGQVEGDDGVGGDEEGGHKKDLEALKKKDPEFYKYLQEHDQELLDFGDEDEGEEKEEEVEQAADVEQAGEEEGGAKGPRVLTIQMIAGWVKALETGGSFPVIRDLVRAFESACHIDNVDDKLGKGMKKGGRGEEDSVRLKFRVVSGQVFERLMRVCITKMHVFFAKYLELAVNGVHPPVHSPLQYSCMVAKNPCPFIIRPRGVSLSSPAYHLCAMLLPESVHCSDTCSPCRRYLYYQKIQSSVEPTLEENLKRCQGICQGGDFFLRDPDGLGDGAHAAPPRGENAPVHQAVSQSKHSYFSICFGYA